MSDVNQANGQYENPPFGIAGDITSTGLAGSDPGTTYGAYADGRLPGESLDADISQTGSPGTEPSARVRDGGDATVTNGGHAGIPDGTVTGPTATGFDAEEIFLDTSADNQWGPDFPDNTTNNTGTARTVNP